MELRLIRFVAAAYALFTFACASIPAARLTTAPQQPTFSETVESLINQPPFNHALWGIQIEEEDGTVLYSRNADLLMMPASNRKLFVAALAANCIGLNTTIPTELWIEGTVDGDTLSGDLVLKGYGDPSLGGRYEHDRDDRLRPFLDAITARGIRQVSGGIVADVSRFDRETIHGSWQWDDLPEYYAAPVHALAWNENVVGARLDARDCSSVHVTTDPGFVPVTSIDLVCTPAVEGTEEIEPEFRADATNGVYVSGEIDTRTAAKPLTQLVAVSSPGLYAAQALEDFLERNGITFAREPSLQVVPRTWSEKLATIESPPMYLLLGTFLKVSQNLFGEMFFKGSARQDLAGYKAARETERLFLIHEVGLQPNEFAFADGSGLSTQNFVTPRAIMRMVRYMGEPTRRGLYSELLAIPGEEGTLRRRLAGLETSVRAKTGTIYSVNALSGFVVGRNDQLRYFVIVANHHIGGSSAATAIIDAIVRRLSEI